MDMKFNKVTPKISKVAINTSAASEHVAKVERRIRVIKERCRACMALLPFKRISNVVTINLVHFCIFWLNAIPVKADISSIYSPTEMICHQKVDAKKWCKLMFGDYVEVHEENTITNSTKPRTRPAICIGLSGNLQGLIKFMCIETAKKIVRRNYTRPPMHDSVIKNQEWSKF